ncbi:hypothetical protein KDAU_65590 [Dictyobacter aurantiacus]|uniref:Uncharacterized protein n=2 Tax=Dictyobacter aurantiacus TaxID=1936993 RepID=A0A401ZQZ8_9CHLR|nr:hypothetical protein KDAU_65590 [Dictyobacter aurantiacus]
MESFSQYVQALQVLGVEKYDSYLTDGHSEFFGKDGHKIVSPSVHVTLTYEQFRYGFTNALSEEEARQLYDRYAVPGSGTPVFQAAATNLNPWTEDQLNIRNPERGPLLLIAGEQDHIVPLAVVKAAYKLQQQNPSVTALREMSGREHSLIIDHGWREVAEFASAFIAEHLLSDQ